MDTLVQALLIFVGLLILLVLTVIVTRQFVQPATQFIERTISNPVITSELDAKFNSLPAEDQRKFRMLLDVVSPLTPWTPTHLDDDIGAWLKKITDGKVG